MDRTDEVNPYAYPPTQPGAPDELATGTATDGYGPEGKPFFSGQALVALLIGFGAILAISGWLYHHESRRIPQTFWGFESPKIFREAKEVTAYLIRPEDSLTGEKPEFYDNLFMIDDLRYVMIGKKSLVGKASFDRVREILMDYTNYQSMTTAWSNPVWRFALEFHYKSDDPDVPGDYTAVIVFDEECKLGRPQTVGKVISTAPMSAELLAYFEGLFPESKTMQDTAPVNVFSRPLVEPGAEPTPTATATGTAIPAPPVVAAPTATGTAPTTFGPAMPDYSKPVPLPVAVAAPTPSATAPAATKPAPAPSSPFTVGPALVPQIPGLPGGSPVGGPLLPGGSNAFNPGAPAKGPANPLMQGLPSSPGGGLNLGTSPSITVPPLKGVPSGQK